MVESGATAPSRLAIRTATDEFLATVVAHGTNVTSSAAASITGCCGSTRWPTPAVEAHGGHLVAPDVGTVVAVLVAAGDKVERGAPLLILEAMKMEHTIAAPAAGVVSAVNYRAGDQVKEGADLVELADA
jgi:3-methylcrotonyl-CoA carboxylase alpha subunit